MKRFLWTALLVLGSLSSTAKEIRVATIQFESKNGAFDANLAQATELLRIAQQQGAEIALLPEFALIGYDLTPNIWESAEIFHGRTTTALSKLAQETQMYIGTSFLEVSDEHFYNTFVLLEPTGKVAGKVRKQEPAGAEGYFFRGDTNHHVIESEVGSIGIGVCQENYRCFLPQQLHEGGADIALMPFSYPDLSASGGLASPRGSYIGIWYAEQLGIPIVTSNKTGLWPQIEGAYFPGNSAIINSSGDVAGELGNEPGVLVAVVTIDASKKRAPTVGCIGPFIKDLTLGNWIEKRMTWVTLWLMTAFQINSADAVHQTYLDNTARKAAARTYSAEP